MKVGAIKRGSIITWGTGTVWVALAAPVLHVKKCFQNDALHDVYGVDLIQLRRKRGAIDWRDEDPNLKRVKPYAIQSFDQIGTDEMSPDIRVFDSLKEYVECTEILAI